MFNINTHELAWCAGFFDGEGSTHCRIDGNLVLSVSQKGKIPLERFKSALGDIGSITFSEGYHKGLDKDYELYKFSIGNFQHVQFAMALLWKYLCPIKKEQYRKGVTRHLIECKKNNMSQNPRAITQRRYIKRKANRINMHRYLILNSNSQGLINPFESGQKKLSDFAVIDA